MIDAEKLNSPDITNVIIGDKPNTYTFTKSLAENILETEGLGLPISIIRPSIVAASWRDPFPGTDQLRPAKYLIPVSRLGGQLQRRHGGAGRGGQGDPQDGLHQEVLCS